MRVNYLHQYFTLPSESGGTRSYEFARRWIANGKQVRIITSNYRLPSEYHNITRITRTTISGIPVSIIPSNYSNNMSYTERIRSFISFALAASREAVHQPADIIYATSTPLTIAIPGIVGKLAQRKPLIMEIRDLWPEAPIAMGALESPLFRQLARALEWSAYHTSAHIIALSPYMAEGIARRGIPHERITVVPNGSDIEVFTGASGTSTGDPIRRKLGISIEQPLIVYTGAFGHVNGLTYLVDVATHMKKVDPSIGFLLVGDGVEKEQVQQAAERCEVLNKSLWIWEPVAKSDISDILSAATVATSTVIPIKELWNNSANKFFDGLASGTPVAINHGGWLADLLQETGAGIILSPSDPAQAARDLAAFVHDPTRLKQAAEAASCLARERFDRDKLAKQVETVLENVVERNG